MSVNTKTGVDKYRVLQLDIAVGRERFSLIWHRTVTFTLPPHRRKKFVSLYCYSHTLRQEERFLWRAMYVYVVNTTPFLPHVTIILSEVQSRLWNERREIISRPKFSDCYTRARQLGGEVFNNYDYL